MEILLKPQEESTNAKFDSQVVATQGFIAEFGDEAFLVAVKTLEKIIAERVNSVDGADYLQVCEYAGIKFWVSDDGNAVTFLLPCEYGAASNSG
jgi:tetraacyldisaccharide-1-P 4'-kinase